MPKYIIAAGSSHPYGKAYLDRAKNLLCAHNKFRICGQSRILKNGSLGTKLNRLFYNCAFALSTYLEPLILYRELYAIEHQLGRIRSYKNAPRTIDLDILMTFNLEYKSSTFFVPHKEFYTRSFSVICALEAIQSAHWPTPQALVGANARLGFSYASFMHLKDNA